VETSFAEIWRLHSRKSGDFIRAILETSFEQIWRLHSSKFGDFKNVILEVLFAKYKRFKYFPIRGQRSEFELTNYLGTLFAITWRIPAGKFLETSFEQIWRLHSRKFGDFIRKICNFPMLSLTRTEKSANCGKLFAIYAEEGGASTIRNTFGQAAAMSWPQRDKSVESPPLCKSTQKTDLLVVPPVRLDTRRR